MNYWQQQTNSKPLFPDLIWSKPEQLAQAGTLGIVGGNKLGFLVVANAYQAALKTGIGEVKIVLPKDLKKPLGDIKGATFAPSNLSGSLAKDALEHLFSLNNETDGILLIGDAGRNTETQMLYETFFRDNLKTNPVIITRDSVDLLLGVMHEIIERPNIILVLSFSQLQKVFQSVYYPVVLVHSIQTSKLVEAIHKFTITHPATITVFHNDQFIVAKNGEVITADFDRPTDIWQGNLPAKIAVWNVWNPTKPLEATVTALL